MKKDYKLYNMILPPYLIMTISPLLIIPLVGNYIIDSIVLLIISAFVFKKLDKKFYWRNIFKVWGLGFAADFVGLLFIFILSTIGYVYINTIPLKDFDNPGFMYNLMSGFNDVSNHAYNVTPYSVGLLVSAVVISAIGIFLLDYFIAFRKADMTKKQKIMSALTFAILTAPYTFLIPNSFFYGS